MMTKPTETGREMANVLETIFRPKAYPGALLYKWTGPGSYEVYQYQLGWNWFPAK